MPSSKATLAAHLAKGRAVKAEKQAQLSSESAFEDLWGSLQSANARIAELENELAQKSAELAKLQTQLDKSTEQCSQLASGVALWKSKHEATYHELRMQRQTSNRGQVKIAHLNKQLEILKKAEATASASLLKDSQNAQFAIASLRKANTSLQNELSTSVTRWAFQLEKTRVKLGNSQSRRSKLQKEVTALRKFKSQSQIVKEQAIARVKGKLLQERSAHHLMNKGIFTEETRNLVRLLVKAGCSRNYINEVISAVLQSAGINTVGTISRPSVTRILREGYYAAQIQLGYEMQNAKSMTFSTDDTSHRSINYNSRHIHLLAEDYTSSSNTDAKKQATHFLGIQSTCTGSSEEAVKEWERALKHISDLYNESPFGKRQGSLLKFIDLMIKLTGINTDHCAKEKKTARLLETLKTWAVDQSLGEDTMLEMSLEDINSMLQKSESEMIKNVGGQRKWDILSDVDKAEKRAEMLESTVAELGREAFEKLSDDEKRFLRLFIWAGCGCHKDLNTVRGGYMAMASWWKENDLEGPVLLANRDNDPVIQERNTAITEGDTPTPAQERAFEQSTRGAIKMAQIAGSIFNHKDDKKGHHDLFRYWWWEHVGTPFTFPDTSNNRFQSYCDAAGALLLYSDQFMEFLENLRINKQNSRLNHMEQNLWNALKCNSTTTELAVLAIYAEAISYPYMKAIRASSDKNQNMLDLGPLHHSVYNHMQKIIADPDILLNKEASHMTAILNGEEWQNLDVVEKIHDCASSLPHLKDLLVAFFKGAAETWKRFISEFAPGGLIDEATTEERELAWMPATNDENEGALGSFRCLMRSQPQLTLLSHNALAIFFRNNTQAFMAAKFTEAADYQYLRKLARDANGDEQKRHKELVEFRDKQQKEKTARKERRAQKSRETAARIAATGLIMDKEKVLALKGQALKDQLKVFKNAGAPNLVKGKLPTLVGEIRQILSDAIDLYQQGEWMLEPDTESASDEAGIENESDWVDEN